MTSHLRITLVLIAALTVAVITVQIRCRPPTFAGEWRRTAGAYVPQNPLLGEQVSITSGSITRGSVSVDGVEHPCDREQYDRDAALTLRDLGTVIRVALDDNHDRLVLGIDREQAVYERRQ